MCLSVFLLGTVFSFCVNIFAPDYRHYLKNITTIWNKIFIYVGWMKTIKQIKKPNVYFIFKPLKRAYNYLSESKFCKQVYIFAFSALFYLSGDNRLSECSVIWIYMSAIALSDLLECVILYTTLMAAVPLINLICNKLREQHDLLKAQCISSMNT